MNVTFYRTNSENNKLNKSLSDDILLEGYLREETSITSPSILVEGDVSSYNYAYVEEFSRYYFITDIASVRAGIWRVDMRVDVLMSYSIEIGQIDAILERQENIYNLYVHDELLPSLEYSNVYTEKFKFSGGSVPPLDDWKFYLTVAGSGS